MHKVRIGIISFEHMHAFSYTSSLKKIPVVEIVGIYDSNEYRGTEMATKFDTKYYNESSKLLDSQLDGVVICTNNRDHLPFIEEAIKRNIPFIVEKPLTNSLENGDKILELSKSGNARGMLAFPMRFNPSIREAKKLVDSGEIGDIVSITGINHGKIPSGWFIDEELSGGGAIIDHTVHLADLIRWFTNEEFSSVICEGGELIHNKGIDDTGIILATLTNGCCVSIDCSWAHHDNYPIWPQVDMDIVGTKGSINVKAFNLTTNQINKMDTTNEMVMWSEDGDYEMMLAFVQYCQDIEHKDSPTIYDGYKALEVADYAYQSLKANKLVNL